MHNSKADRFQLPAFHVIHSIGDTTVPAANSKSYAEHLRNLGAKVRLTLIPSASHMGPLLALDTHPNPLYIFDVDGDSQ